VDVGAHEFRNHFGYYMDVAAVGNQILVRRHGRPFVRLLAATAPPPAQEPRSPS
jgi:prevent-host-death family protein